VFSIGLGITLGILNVFFRDIGQLYEIVLQFWFWMTPIVYSVDILPESIRNYFKINPISNLMMAYQKILVNGQWPQWKSLWLISLLALLFCWIAAVLFRKHAGEMVDEL
jgi:lipopolysaccharide transport system permease protein